MAPVAFSVLPLLRISLCVYHHVVCNITAPFSNKVDGTDVSVMYRPRFVSEYGFQAMPYLTTLKHVSTPSDWHSHSPYMLLRNHHKGGQDEMILQIRSKFKWPATIPVEMSEDMFDQFCYLSQCSQAWTVKAQSEHYRRLRSDELSCMGALYWQCNDICRFFRLESVFLSKGQISLMIWLASSLNF